MSNKEQRSSRVRFGSISIHQFSPTIGDNPSVRGAPIALGNEIHTMTVSLDRYEVYRAPRRRKNPEDLLLDAAERSLLLLQQGFSLGEICAAVDKITTFRLSVIRDRVHNRREAPDRSNQTLKGSKRALAYLAGLRGSSKKKAMKLGQRR